MEQTNRYRFYREHKFVIAFVNDMTRLIGMTDFTDTHQVSHLSQRVEGLIALLQGHAQHEETAYHSLLEAKGSTAHDNVQKDHSSHASLFAEWRKQLQSLQESQNNATRSAMGYDFYLSFRAFEAQNLIHMNEEERVIMPELQKLYTDDELRAIEATVYQKSEMTPDAMINMLSTLFPHMNTEDQQVFLSDIKAADPQKHILIYSKINQIISADPR